jgi:hypothetical protein
MLPKSRVQALKALLADQPPRRGWREWLAATNAAAAAKERRVIIYMRTERDAKR